MTLPFIYKITLSLFDLSLVRDFFYLTQEVKAKGLSEEKKWWRIKEYKSPTNKN